ncbi:NusG domain II-containing protein [Acidaminobacter sp. JC074]|uniref:NusG domain II-containing protein n=1 Tax=Acidaminobacter sp. JC074 TaxID=2530199 RepID=UPI001F0F95BD|nr:NusG domain II-containing protein [Acidaminobacter sp. JC074]MCH4890557.1 NusG domain II-containing protein [Acidaminobacter sp. JC074]
MKRGDIKVIIIILIGVVLSYGYAFFMGLSNDDKIVRITRDQTVLHEFKIDESYMNTLVLEENDHFNIVEISGGEVWMKEANCPNQVCVRHQPISIPGESIICIPHKLVIEIIGQKTIDVMVD